MNEHLSCKFIFQDDFDYEIKSPPMMVPMADVLNHVAKNNAKLKFGKENLKMVSCQPIKKVFNICNKYKKLILNLFIMI